MCGTRRAATATAISRGLPDTAEFAVRCRAVPTKMVLFFMKEQHTCSVRPELRDCRTWKSYCLFGDQFRNAIACYAVRLRTRPKTRMHSQRVDRECPDTDALFTSRTQSSGALSSCFDFAYNHGCTMPSMQELQPQSRSNAKDVMS